MLGLTELDMNFINTFIQGYKPCANEFGDGEYVVIINDIQIYLNSKGHRTFRAIFEIVRGQFIGRKIYFDRVLEVKRTENWSSLKARQSVVNFLADFGIELEDGINIYTFQDDVNSWDWKGTQEGSPQRYKIYYSPNAWDKVIYLGVEGE